MQKILENFLPPFPRESFVRGEDERRPAARAVCRRTRRSISARQILSLTTRKTKPKTFNPLTLNFMNGTQKAWQFPNCSPRRPCPHCLRHSVTQEVGLARRWTPLLSQPVTCSLKISYQRMV